MSNKTKGVQLEYSAENLDCYNKLFVLLYADDTILISESPEDLQKMSDNLHEYCIKWKLHINASNTKIVIFLKGRIKNLPTWTLGTHNLGSYTRLNLFRGSIELQWKVHQSNS